MAKLDHEHEVKGEAGPEKLHFPEQRTCSNGHDLIDEKGHPTENLAWDYEGKPKCKQEDPSRWAILEAVKKYLGVTGDTCPNGHQITPDTVKYTFKRDGDENGIEMSCEVCGAQITGEVRKATFDEAKHQAYDPAKHGTYRKYNPEAHESFMTGSTKGSKGFRGRARTKQTDITSYSAAGDAPPNFDVKAMIDKGHVAGALKNGDQISFDHFIPIAAGGAQSPENFVAISTKMNTIKNDSMPSTYEAKKFGMEHFIPLIKVLNPRNIGYLNENGVVDESRKTTHGYIRDEAGNVTGVINHSDQGSGTLRSNDFHRVNTVLPRLYGSDSSEPGGMQTISGGKVITRHYGGPNVEALPGAMMGGGGANVAAVHRFDPHKKANKAKDSSGKKIPGSDRAEYVPAMHSADAAYHASTGKQMAISAHEFPKGKRNANVQAHLDALVGNIGPIPGFDHSETGQAMYHHIIGQSGKPAQTMIHPAIKAHMLNYLHQEGAKRVLPSPIAEHGSAVLGHPSQFKLPEGQHASFLQNLQQHTGTIDFGNHPQTLFVDHPSAGKIINPAVRKHVRNYVKREGGMREAHIMQLQLSEDLPVTLRKVKNDGSDQPYPAQHRHLSRQGDAHRHTAVWLRR